MSVSKAFRWSAAERADGAVRLVRSRGSPVRRADKRYVAVSAGAELPQGCEGNVAGARASVEFTRGRLACHYRVGGGGVVMRNLIGTAKHAR